MADRTSTRRNFLKSAAAAAGAAVSGCAGSPGPGESTETPSPTGTPSPSSSPTDTPTETPTETETPDEWTVDPLEHDKLIGAHYYPWYTDDRHWLDETSLTPVLGNYDSESEEVVNQHIKWAVEKGIKWLPVSWADPDHNRATWIEDHFLPAELSRQISFSLRYESPPQMEMDGNRISFDNGANRRQLVNDFRKIEEKYLDASNHQTIDGKPVIIIYATSLYEGDIRGAFKEAKAGMSQEPYLIAEGLHLNPATPNQSWLEEFDGMSSYNIYNPGLVSEYGEEFWDIATKLEKDWKFSVENAGLEFFPNIIPRYDDTPTKNHPVLPYDGEKFRDFCRDLSPLGDDRIKGYFVTSFNEFPEGTAVEPTEEAGEEPLNIIAEELASSSPDYVSKDDFTSLTLKYNKTESPGSRDLAFALSRLNIDGGGNYDIGKLDNEPVWVQGAYFPEKDDGSELGTWRWLGGEGQASTLLLATAVNNSSEGTIYGRPISDDITADVFVEGKQTDSIAFHGGRPREYGISLR